MEDFREKFRAFIEKVYIPSNADKATTSRKWDEIYSVLLPNIPEKLFRYRGVTEYSMNDFQNGTISLCHARKFPDKYDSYVYINQDVIQQGLLGSLKEAYRLYLINVINASPLVQNKRKADEVREYLKNGYNIDQITEIVINREYPDYINEVKAYMKKQEARFRSPKNSAKVACFTESVRSKFMWDAYADGYKGFALEYDFRMLKQGREGSHELELFPMIYADERPDATNDENDYCSIPDNNSLKAIYYGPDISDIDRNKLHKIAQEKGLAEFDVKLDVDSRNYSLKVIPL